MLCPKHKVQLVKFCVVHDEPVCTKCIEESHIHCHGTVSLETASKHWRDIGKLDDIKHCLLNTQRNILKVKDGLTEGKKSLVLSKSTVLQNIKEAREQVNQHFDRLEKAIEDQLDCLYIEGSRETEALLKTLSQINNNLESLRNETSHWSATEKHEEVFLKIYLAEKSLQELRNEFECLLTSINSVHISCTLNPTIEKFTSNVKTLGTLDLVKAPLKIGLHDIQHIQAQTPLRSPDARPSILVSELREIDIPVSDQSRLITSCLALPDQRVIFIDRNSLEIIAYDYKKNKTERIAKIMDSPYDATLVSERDLEIGVTFGSKAYISKINLENGKVSNKISMPGFCSGICYNEGCFFIVVQSKGIYKVSLSGTYNLLIKVPTIHVGYVNIVNDRLVFSDAKNRSVNCYKTSGEQLWTYKMDDSSCPRGVKITQALDVIVADCKSNKIVCITADGRQALTLVDCLGLHEPFCIHLNEHTKQLVICNLMDGKAFSYIISYR